MPIVPSDDIFVTPRIFFRGFNEPGLSRTDSAAVLFECLHGLRLGEKRLSVAAATGSAKRQRRFASDERAEHKRGAGRP